MNSNTTLLFSALAAAALLAGCETTQHNRGSRGIIGGGESAAARQPARVRPAAQPQRTAPAATYVSETPLAAQPQPAAVQSQPVAYPYQPPAQTPLARDMTAGRVAPPATVPAWTPPAAATPAPAAAQPAAAPAAAPAATPAAQPAKPAAPAAPAAPVFETYKVKRGDIAGRIANSHGMTLKEFLEANGMTLEQANKLREGASVKVWAGQEALKPGPAVRAPAKPAAANDPNAYVVQPGDTLQGISAKTGVPVATLMKNNGIDNPNMIRTGRALVLHKDAAAVLAAPAARPPVQPAVAPVQTPAVAPAAAKPAKPAKPAKAPKPAKADKPAAPAAQPAVQPAAVAMPVAPVAPAVQPAKPQDASVPLAEVPVAGTDKSLEDLLGGLSLESARTEAEERKDAAAKEVKEAVQTAKAAAGDAAKAAPAGYRYYTVKEGENLYHLTARFKVPLPKLRELNDLPKTASKLAPGTVLLVPDTAAVAP